MVKGKKTNQLPPYMGIFSNLIYENKIISGIFDDSRIVRLRSLGLQKKIVS